MPGVAQSGPLPLEGVRVADFTWIVAGPQATRILADLGAEVVKVENESYLDSMRMGMQRDPAHPSVNGSGFHSNFNRNKLGITANLHHPRGREVVERLIAQSDVVIENFSAGAFARMGFSYERLRELRPDIIYVSLSGFGHTGRDNGYVTWGPTAQAVSGATVMSGLPGRPPAGWGFSYLDHSAGYHGAVAMLMALVHRNRTGEGQHVDMAQVETGMVLGGIPVLDYQVNGRHYQPAGNRSRHPALAPHGMYRCADGEPTDAHDSADRWIAIACESEAQWHALCKVLGVPELATDARFATNEARVAEQDALDAAITARTRGCEPHELMERLQAARVPAGVAQTTRDKLERDPQHAARGFYPTASHPELGEHRFEGLPVHLSAARWRMERAAPQVGEHTEHVLTELLGYSADEVDALRMEAAI